MNDVFEAILEVPIKELLTSNGDLTRRDVILHRCIRYVASILDKGQAPVPQLI